MKTPTVLVSLALAALAGGCWAVPAPSAPGPAPAVADAKPSATAAIPAVAPAASAAPVPVVPMEPAVPKAASPVAATATPSPPAPPSTTEASKAAEQVADKKMAPLLAVQAVGEKPKLADANASKGAIGVKAVGETCTENGDCRRLPNTYCKAGSCHCTSGFVFSDDGAKCLPVATAANPSCAESRQCVIMLQSPAGPTGPAVCVEGKCRCRYDHELVNGTCILKKARGKSCSVDAECEDLVGGACIQDVCSCKQDFTPAVAANKCLPVLHGLSEACEEDIQCSEGLGDLARCTAGKCVCADGASISDATKKCECAADEELSKATARCEKTVLGNQQAVKETQAQKGGASSLQSSLTFAILVVSWAVGRGVAS